MISGWLGGDTAAFVLGVPARGRVLFFAQGLAGPSNPNPITVFTQFSILTEAPAFQFQSALLSRVPVTVVVDVSTVLLAVRLGCYALLPHAPSAWAVLPIELLHGGPGLSSACPTVGQGSSACPAGDARPVYLFAQDLSVFSPSPWLCSCPTLCSPTCWLIRAPGVTFATSWGAGIVTCKGLAPTHLNATMQARGAWLAGMSCTRCRRQASTVSSTPDD
jgi:hypothetical protein